LTHGLNFTSHGSTGTTTARTISLIALVMVSAPSLQASPKHPAGAIVKSPHPSKSLVTLPNRHRSALPNDGRRIPPLTTCSALLTIGAEVFGKERVNVQCAYVGVIRAVVRRGARRAFDGQNRSSLELERLKRVLLFLTTAAVHGANNIVASVAVNTSMAPAPVPAVNRRIFVMPSLPGTTSAHARTETRRLLTVGEES